MYLHNQNLNFDSYLSCMLASVFQENIDQGLVVKIRSLAYTGLLCACKQKTKFSLVCFENSDRGGLSRSKKLSLLKIKHRIVTNIHIPGFKYNSNIFVVLCIMLTVNSNSSISSTLSKQSK